MLTICYVTVQQQSYHNGSDCGLYAIAFGFVLCSGNDPIELPFSRLATSINEGQFTTFPEASVGLVGNDIGKIVKLFLCIVFASSPGQNLLNPVGH